MQAKQQFVTLKRNVKRMFNETYEREVVALQAQLEDLIARKMSSLLTTGSLGPADKFDVPGYKLVVDVLTLCKLSSMGKSMSSQVIPYIAIQKL